MKNMLASVREYLSSFGEVDERVIEAMSKIDRKNFVASEFRDRAYEDSALPIEEGQTISQPSTVARMLSLLELKEGDKVLEVGTGSGWNAALISYIIGKNGRVTSLERYDGLIEKARERVKTLGIENVEIRKKDFRLIDDRFDKIMFTAGIIPRQEEGIERVVERFLNDRGILVCPYQSGHLIIAKKKKGKLEKRYTEESYVFVPLIL